jgi:hypothetical protein
VTPSRARSSPLSLVWTASFLATVIRRLMETAPNPAASRATRRAAAAPGRWRPRRASFFETEAERFNGRKGIYQHESIDRWPALRKDVLLFWMGYIVSFRGFLVSLTTSEPRAANGTAPRHVTF